MDKQLKPYNIVFSSLKLGKHTFSFTLDESFFSVFGFSDFTHPKLLAEVFLEKKNTMLTFSIALSGDAEVVCDLTNTPFRMPLHNQLDWVVKFGEAYNDENEEILILPFGEYEINIAQYLYEAAVLALPQKRVHPGVASGDFGQDYLEKLESLSPKFEESDEENDEEKNEVDPRWDKLKDLLN